MKAGDELPRHELPSGFRLVLDPGLRRADEGRVLIGGAPLRLVRLKPAGSAQVDQWGRGEPVGPARSQQRLARRLLDAGMAHPRPGEAGLGPDDVTAIIPVRDDAAGLRRVIASLGPVGAVTVVDDASDPSLAAAPGATLLRHAVNLGPAAARNTGWRASASPLVAFVDADCEPDPGWLECLLPHFDDPAVGAVAPRVVASTAHVRPRWLGAYEQAASPLDLGPLEGPVRPRGRVSYVPSAALVVRRTALEAVDGFDDALRLGEDVDLVWRLHEAGWTVRYEPTAVARHRARPTAPAMVRQRAAYGSSAAALDARHPGAVAPLTVSAWSAASWLLAMAGRPAVATGVTATTTALLVPKLRPIDQPWRHAARIAGIGHLHAGRLTADALLRAWWPLTVLLALRSRRARRTLAVAAVAPALTTWWATRPALDPLRWTAASVIDDASYATGVWLGCLRARSLRALVPDLTSWPGRAQDGA